MLIFFLEKLRNVTLIYAKRENIDTIIRRVDGKVKFIRRQATSQKNNVSFDYNPMGEKALLLKTKR